MSMEMTQSLRLTPALELGQVKTITWMQEPEVKLSTRDGDPTLIIKEAGTYIELRFPYGVECLLRLQKQIADLDIQKRFGKEDGA